MLLLVGEAPNATLVFDPNKLTGIGAVANSQLLWISRKFFSNCYPGVTQREFSNRLVQKGNPLSH
jgi:hypothetical protein